MNTPCKKNDFFEAFSVQQKTAAQSLFLHIYSRFDGFKQGDFDGLSFLRIWPLAEIIQFSDRRNSCYSDVIAFADFSIGTEVYGISTTQPLIGIVLWPSGETTGIATEAFINAICHGKFDSGIGILA